MNLVNYLIMMITTLFNKWSKLCIYRVLTFLFFMLQCRRIPTLMAKVTIKGGILYGSN
jgi:succinate-acetate transporter protein